MYARSVFPRGPTRLSFAIAVAVLSFFPASAVAQTATDQAAAETLFKVARDLMAAGKYAEACPKLAESQRLDPGTGTLLNLASCYEKNGQVTSAWATYKEAESAAQSAGEPNRVKLARTRAAALEATLPTLTIVVPASVDRPDLQIMRDGAVVGRAAWGTPIPVDPGSHVVEATAPGRKTWEGHPRVNGAGAAVSLEIPPLETEAPAPPAATVAGAPTVAPSPSSAPPSAASSDAPRASPRSGSTQRAAGLVLGGVGIAGLVAGGISGGLALKKKNDVPAQCNGSVCNADGISSLDGAKNAATISTISFIAGGALVATGAIVFLVAPRAPATTGWTFSPGSDGAIAGLTLRRAW